MNESISDDTLEPFFPVEMTGSLNWTETLSSGIWAEKKEKEKVIQWSRVSLTWFALSCLTLCCIPCVQVMTWHGMSEGLLPFLAELQGSSCVS